MFNAVTKKPLRKVSAVTEKPEKPLQKVPEVARLLGVSRAYVYILMERGELSYVKLGKTRRIRPEEVERMIEANTI